MEGSSKKEGHCCADSSAYERAISEFEKIAEPLAKEKKLLIAETTYEKAINDLDIKAKEEGITGEIQDREERKKFSNRIFILLSCFIGATLLIILFSGTCLIDLSDAVLITLLSTTTANVIGIFMYVTKYLFGSKICPKCGNIKMIQSQIVKQ